MSINNKLEKPLESEKLNPFPATAVSRLINKGNGLVSIQTDATIKAHQITSSYLESLEKSKIQENTGQVIAIVGEYGTGKTHLAFQVISEIEEHETSKTDTFYLDAPADSFHALYKDRFFPLLSKSEVIRRIEDYFSDIVADDLSKSELTLATAQALKNRITSPLEVIKKFGLMDSTYRGQLNNELKRITENEDFATAFSLMLRPEFEDAVWEWLKGESPDPSLKDRGINRTLNSDISVLEAIGVFAFLFGQQNYRFILVIDEMEKVLSPSSKSQNKETLLAFKKLMEAIGKTNSMLLLVGLPDFIETLPDDAQQRISSIIRPSSLTSKNVEAYILEAKIKAGLSNGIKPFTKDVVKYISEIAGGNARKVIRLCFHLYRNAVESGINISRAMVREVSREQFETSTNEDIFNEITRVIDLNGWLYEKDNRYSLNDKEFSVDFSIPLGEDVCNVFVENSILDSSIVKELISKNNSVTEKFKNKQCLCLLVVNGHIAENLKATLEKAFDRVLMNATRTFSDDLDAILKGMIKRIEEKSDKETLTKVLQRVEQISRQISSLRHEVDEKFERTNLSHQAYDLENAVLGAFRNIVGSNVSPRLQNSKANMLFDSIDSRISSMELNFLHEAPASESFNHEIGNIKAVISNFRRDLNNAERMFFGLRKQKEFEREFDRICRRYHDDFHFNDRWMRVLSEVPYGRDVSELEYLIRELPRQVYESYKGY